MRIRRLTVGEVGIDLELHPRVTVVRGLTPAHRAEVIEGLQRFLSGQPGAAVGILEIDGAEFDIEPDVLDLLDLPPDVPNIVIRAADLKRVLHPADGKDVTTFGRGAELEEELDRLDGRLAALAERRTELADEIEPSELRERVEAATAPDAVGVDESDGGTDERIAEVELEIAALKARLAELDAESAGGGGAR